jgi:hypothetical protein
MYVHSTFTFGSISIQATSTEKRPVQRNLAKFTRYQVRTSIPRHYVFVKDIVPMWVRQAERMLTSLRLVQW